jgi:recombination DNA repair RAD52 pathway protein
MRLSPEQTAALRYPRLNESRVASRRQGGATLNYLEAWDIKATLIRVFGYAGFSADVIDVDVFHLSQAPGQGDRPGNWTAGARCTVRLTLHDPTDGLDVTYTECAASSQTNPQVGEAVDFAIKTAESDALKRAAIYLGTQFGLSLYDSGKTTDVVRKVFAPGQMDEDVASFTALVDPGTGMPLTDEQQAKMSPEARKEAEELVRRAIRMRQERQEIVTEEQIEGATWK